MGIVISQSTILPFLFLAVTILVNAIFGLIVLTRTYHKAYGWYFAGTVLGVAAWAFGDMIMLFAKDPAVVHLGALLFYIGPMFIPIFIWFFSLSFPEERKVSPGAIIGSASVIAVYAFLFITNFEGFIKSIEINPGVNIPVPQTPGYIFYAAFFSAFFMLVYATFFLKVKRLRGISKIQVAYTFYGAFGASVPALITNLSLPLMGKGDILWLGPFFTLLFAVSVTAAIVRHKLFDIRFYAIRAATYLLTIVVAMLAYVIPAVLVTTYLLHVSLPATTILVLALITLAVAVLFRPLTRVFKRLTNRLFYQDVYDPQSFIDQLNKVLVENVELDKLLHESAKVIENNLKAEFCLFGVRETKFHKQRVVGTIEKDISAHDLSVIRHMKPRPLEAVIITDNLPIEQNALKRTLSKNNIAILAQLGSEADSDKEGLGYLYLGQKRSGNPYNHQDIKTINIIAKELLSLSRTHFIMKRSRTSTSPCSRESTMLPGNYATPTRNCVCSTRPRMTL